MILIVCLAHFSATGLSVARADSADFEKMVTPFLENYCMDCHDAETKKGNLSLDGLEMDLGNFDQLEVWRMIRDAVHFRDMPPEKKKQPTCWRSF